jgi:hypothetical protein
VIKKPRGRGGHSPRWSAEPEKLNRINHQNRVVIYYQIAGLAGKAYVQSATAAFAADGFQKTGLLPCVTYFLGESERTITRCLLESPVPCTSISEQPHTTSGTNPQTLPTVTPPVSQNASAVVLPSNIGPVQGIFGRKQEEVKQNMQHSLKVYAAILTVALQKQTSRRPQEERD